MPDWQFQPCVIPRMAFLLSDRINKMNKMTSEKVNGADSVDSVHSVEKSLPNSRRIHVSGFRKAQTVACIRGPSRDATLVRATRYHHARDGIHRHSREPRTRSA